MQTISDPITEDMEKMSQEEFAAMYCSNAKTNPCHDCDECERLGTCCLTCRFRQECQYICQSEKARVKLDALSTDEFCTKMFEHEEHLLTFVATERIQIAENRIAELIEKHVSQCLNCEKLDFATQIVELEGCIENLRNIIKSDQETRLQAMNEWLGKYNIPYDCGWREAIDKLITGGTEVKP